MDIEQPMKAAMQEFARIYTELLRRPEYCKIFDLFFTTDEPLQPFIWERIYTFEKFYPTEIDFDNFCKYLLLSLNKYECADAFLISAIINLNNRRIMEQPTQTEWNDPDDGFFSEFSKRRELVNVCDGVIYDNMDIAIVIDEGEWEFMKVLARFGVIKLVDLGREVGNSLIDYLINSLTSPFKDSSLWYDAKDYILAKLKETYYTSLDGQGSAKFVRKRFVVLNSFSYMYHQYWKNPQLGKCLQLYFEAIPEPFVTVKEIKELIDIAIRGQPFFDEQRINSDMEIFRSLFPESDILQPRSLKHLSRCAVRSHISKQGVLPEVLSKLPIPQIIKDYILISKLEL